MPEDKDRNKEMETLSKAIVEAIMGSKEVRTALDKISDKEELFSGSLMVLMLKLQNLSDNIEKGDFDKVEEHSKAISDEISRIENEKQIDNELYDEGKKLSTNEAAFRKFLSEQFDQDGWLKRHGIII